MRPDADYTHKYDDIIDHPHHVSSTRAHMSRADRAAQFSPFAAVVGYDASIQEARRLTDQKIELDENEKSILDGKLNMIRDHLAEHPVISFLFFQPDDRKSGGAYLTIEGSVKRFDDVRGVVIFTDKTEIPIEDIAEISGEFFDRLERELGSTLD